jgi:hypothetical protein
MPNSETNSTTKHTCDICGEEFDSITDLELHRTDHLQPEESEVEHQQEIRGDIGAAGMPTSPRP